MVAVEQDARTGERQIVLRPNHVVDRRQTLVAYIFAALMCLAVAVAMTVLGFWPVLIAAGLELGLLGWALYVSAQRAQEIESITLRDGRIEVRKHRRRSGSSWVFESYWTEVAFEPPVYRWYPNRLMLRSGRERVELGQFLRDDERAELADRLRRWVGPMAASGECV